MNKDSGSLRLYFQVLVRRCFIFIVSLYRTLFLLENNKFNPSVETLIQLIRKYNVDLKWILLGKKGFIGKVFKGPVSGQRADTKTNQGDYNMNSTQNERITQITATTLTVGVDIAKFKHVARAEDFRGVEVVWCHIS
ncbi:hypothetical protein ACFSR7_08815 [Cohnella sp. GCM10020058]|uniref:hypothetical protein n=1 Tax=Cohnella sp. GCM10020058 TaxID=3317330 RepID=UPI00362D8231